MHKTPNLGTTHPPHHTTTTTPPGHHNHLTRPPQPPHQATAYFDHSESDGSNVPAGYSFSTQVLVKTPPKSVATWEFMLDITPDTDLSVCSVTVIAQGSDLPYVDRLSLTSFESAGGRNDKGWLTLYHVTNIGVLKLLLRLRKLSREFIILQFTPTLLPPRE